MVFYCIHPPPSGNLSQYETLHVHSDPGLQYTHLGVQKKNLFYFSKIRLHF